MLKFTNKYLNLLYAYNICHSVLDLLYFHEFFWEGAGGKGRGKDARKKGKKANLKKMGFNVQDIWLCGNVEISIYQYITCPCYHTRAPEM